MNLTLQVDLVGEVDSRAMSDPDLDLLQFTACLRTALVTTEFTRTRAEAIRIVGLFGARDHRARSGASQWKR